MSAIKEKAGMDSSESYTSISPVHNIKRDESHDELRVDHSSDNESSESVVSIDTAWTCTACIKGLKIEDPKFKVQFMTVKGAEANLRKRTNSSMELFTKMKIGLSSFSKNNETKSIMVCKECNSIVQKELDLIKMSEKMAIYKANLLLKQKKKSLELVVKPPPSTLGLLLKGILQRKAVVLSSHVLNPLRQWKILLFFESLEDFDIISLAKKAKAGNQLLIGKAPEITPA